MKTVSDTLLEHIHNAREFLTVDLYTLSVKLSGTVHAFKLCDLTQNLQIGTDTYLANKGILERTQTKLTNELSVDSVTFSLYLNHDVFGSVGDLQAAAHRGDLDHSTFAFARAYFDASTQAYKGKVDLFKGQCQVVSAGGLLLKLSASSDATALNLSYPVRRFYPQASYVSNGAGGVAYSYGDNNRSCMIPLKPNKGVML